ncbi:MAG: 30S ribosome-binding factor RbfA [Chloroflexota bacterium]|nr:30S ribosome-binding factor RbfA [Chloroflexota bacterium]MDE2942520.1 30S ribosome-binding factor RbfA [Chloroflexota bacterium]MDE3266880.1 30S ribosome-binding factor RbfA [Chloroflexota bacterium]
MQAFRRTDRVNVLLRQQLSEIIAREVKDPRLARIITIVHVDVSHDLRHARVHTSVLGGPDERKAAVDTLNRAAGFIRRELKGRISLKSVPHLSFVPDDSIEQGDRLQARISQVRAADSPSQDAD